MTIEKPLTPNQAAKVLGISGPTVRRLCETGELENFRLGGRIVRIHRDALDAFIVRHTRSRSNATDAK